MRRWQRDIIQVGKQIIVFKGKWVSRLRYILLKDVQTCRHLFFIFKLLSRILKSVTYYASKLGQGFRFFLYSN